MQQQIIRDLFCKTGKDCAQAIVLAEVLSEVFDKHNAIQERIAVAQERAAYAQERMAEMQEEQLMLQKKITGLTANMLTDTSEMMEKLKEEMKDSDDGEEWKKNY